MRFLAVLFSVVLGLSSLPAAAADYFGPGYGYGYAPPRSGVEVPGIPLCESESVIGRVVSRQAWAERHTWHDGIVITAIHDPRERALHINGPSMIAHRNCMAQASLSNGRTQTLYYVISQGQGFASLGWNVEWCVVGHDPYHVYDAGCRVLY